MRISKPEIALPSELFDELSKLKDLDEDLQEVQSLIDKQSAKVQAILAPYLHEILNTEGRQHGAKDLICSDINGGRPEIVFAGSVTQKVTWDQKKLAEFRANAAPGLITEKLSVSETLYKQLSADALEKLDDDDVQVAFRQVKSARATDYSNAKFKLKRAKADAD